MPHAVSGGRPPRVALTYRRESHASRAAGGGRVTLVSPRPAGRVTQTQPAPPGAPATGTPRSARPRPPPWPRQPLPWARRPQSPSGGSSPEPPPARRSRDAVRTGPGLLCRPLLSDPSPSPWPHARHPPDHGRKRGRGRSAQGDGAANVRPPPPPRPCVTGNMPETCGPLRTERRSQALARGGRRRRLRSSRHAAHDAHVPRVRTAGEAPAPAGRPGH